MWEYYDAFSGRSGFYACAAGWGEEVVVLAGLVDVGELASKLV